MYVCMCVCLYTAPITHQNILLKWKKYHLLESWMQKVFIVYWSVVLVVDYVVSVLGACGPFQQNNWDIPISKSMFACEQCTMYIVMYNLIH